jgi:hypothetical protein
MKKFKLAHMAPYPNMQSIHNLGKKIGISAEETTHFIPSVGGIHLKSG